MNGLIKRLVALYVAACAFLATVVTAVLVVARFPAASAVILALLAAGFGLWWRLRGGSW